MIGKLAGLVSGPWSVYVIGGLLLALAVGVPSAYLLGSWKGKTEAEAVCKAEKAAVKTAVEYIVKFVDRVITVKDEQTVKKLTSDLANARAQAITLQQRIESHAQQLPNPDPCVLPGGLRDDLNGALAGDDPLRPFGGDGSVPEGNSVPPDDGGPSGHGEGSGGSDGSVSGMQGASRRAD